MYACMYVCICECKNSCRRLTAVATALTSPASPTLFVYLAEIIALAGFEPRHPLSPAIHPYRVWWTKVVRMLTWRC